MQVRSLVMNASITSTITKHVQTAKISSCWKRAGPLPPTNDGLLCLCMRSHAMERIYTDMRPPLFFVCCVYTRRAYYACLAGVVVEFSYYIDLS